MEFDGEVVEFDIYDAMKFPSDDHSLCAIDIVEPFVQDVFDNSDVDKLRNVIEHDIDGFKLDYVLTSSMKEVLAQLDGHKRLPISNLAIGPTLLTPSEKLVPSIVQAPEIELKDLPSHFKYVFLGKHNTFPVIISNKLTTGQEDKLVKVLKEHKTALGWTIADIKGISPSTCMHRILLEDKAKPLGNLKGG